jgi:hypothetical protein
MSARSKPTAPNFDAAVVQLIGEVREKDRAARAFQSPVRGDEIMRFCNLERVRRSAFINRRLEEAISAG